MELEMVIYYHSVTILSMILSAFFLLWRRRGSAVYLPLVFMLMPIICAGFLKVAEAADIGEALAANGTEYLDGCFMELFLFLYITDFCGLRVHRALTAVLLAAGSAVFLLVMNDQKLHLLYSGAGLTSLDGVSGISGEYGPVNTVYCIMVGSYLAADLAAVIFSRVRRSISGKAAFLLSAVCLALITAFLADKVFHTALELLPASCILAQLLLTAVSREERCVIRSSAETVPSESAAGDKAGVKAVFSRAADDDKLTPEEEEKIHRLCPQFDVDLGMSYCMGSKEFWLDTLSAFIDSDSTDDLCRAFDSNDISIYRRAVHCIKSSARAVGAVPVSEKAKLLEEAAGNSDMGYIRSEHGAFIAEYRSLIDGVKRVTEIW